MAMAKIYVKRAIVIANLTIMCYSAIIVIVVLLDLSVNFFYN